MAQVIQTKRLQDWLNVLMAVLLFVSPWFLGFAEEEGPAMTAWISGLIIGLFAVAAIVSFMEWEEWVNVALGVWAIIAPWVVGFGGNNSATWAHVVIGVLVAALAAWELWEVHNPPRAMA